jgi:hypothetical protein
MASFISARQLAGEFTGYACRSLETFIQRFMPDGHAPGFVGGVALGYEARGDLIYFLGMLHQLGFKEVAGHKIETLLVRLLARVNGEETETFYSYRIAETLLRFGPAAGNPLLQELSEAQRGEVIYALDSTHIYEGPGKLRGWPNNYWAVLARTEYARQRLGVLESDALLKECIQRVRELYEGNPHRFLDDSPACEGRFDIYTAETILFMQTMVDLLGRDFWKDVVRRHVELVSQLALENGASVTWGRSIGLHSIFITMELGAMGYRHGLWDEPARALSLARHAFECAQGWFTDGLTNAHQHRTLTRYRRVARRAQMTLDCWLKFAEMAEILLASPDPDASLPLLPKKELFPARDVLLPLDAKGAAVWSYRNEKTAFHLPVVHGHNGDYMPWFHAPGFLENPVDTDHLCGVPRVLFQRVQYTTYGHPSACEKFPNGLRLVYDTFRSMQENHPATTVPGRREVRYQVGADGSITADETWSFSEMPEALGIQFAESARPFHLELDCASPHHGEVVDVSGIIEWRSYWGEIERTHEFNFFPAKNLAFSWKLKPL